MNNKKANSKQQSKKKASSSAIIVVLITLIIAIVSGNSKAAAANAELEKVLKHKVETEKLSVGIAVAIIEKGKVSFINVGVANKETTQELDQNTLFEIGSVSVCNQIEPNGANTVGNINMPLNSSLINTFQFFQI